MGMTPLRTALLASLVALAGGCTVDPTEVIVITDTNLAVPDELDELRIEVTGPRGDVQSSSAFLETPGALPPPRALALVHDDGPLGPFRVRAIGRLNDVDVVERTAVFTFQPERILALRLDLLRDCVGTTCSPGNTCGADGCRSEEVAADELEPFEGELPSGDAGPGEDAGPPPPIDAGDCTPSTEECNETDDDCDGAIDEDFDLSTDAMHCGGCGNTCDAAETCVDSTCTPAGCPSGFADCNGNDADGCETMLGTGENCTACGDRCVGGRICCPSGCTRGASC